MLKKAGAFSAKHNLGILLNAQPGQLRTVDGLRALSILLVLALHSVWFLSVFDPAAVDFFYSSPVWLNWVYNGEFGVDVFFVISGFLISCFLMEEYRNNGNIRFMRFYQRRFLRLMPAYFLAIVFGLLLLPENKQYVWSNLLYINNLMPAETHFMPWTWSLAIEEQFYFLYPLLLVLVLRFVPPRVVVYLAALLFAASLVIRYLVITRYQLTLPVCWYPTACENFNDVIDYLYVKPWTRYGSFLPGIFVAYLHVFHREQLRSFFTGRGKLASLLLIAALAVALAVLSVPLNNQRASFPEGWGTAYYVVFRNLFTSAVGVILLVSLYSESGVCRQVNRFLSSRILYPIGQLAYSAYLFHPFVFAILYAVIIETAKGMPYWQMTSTVAAVGIPLTLLLASVVYIFVERPFMNMRRSTATISAAQAPLTGNELVAENR